MVITRPGRDIISVGEEDWESRDVVSDDKIHLIKLEFVDPNEQKLDWLVDSYPLTNRFIVFDNIKFYNWYFKTKEKKFYVENRYNVGIFSFFKKNNKVLLNFNLLRNDVRNFMLKNSIFSDILRNLEIIQIDEDTFRDKSNILSKWNGNVIVE